MKFMLLGLFAAFISASANAGSLTCGFTSSLDNSAPMSSTVQSEFVNRVATVSLQYKDLESLVVSYESATEILTNDTKFLKHLEVKDLVERFNLPYAHYWAGIYDPTVSPSSAPFLHCIVNR